MLLKIVFTLTPAAVTPTMATSAISAAKRNTPPSATSFARKSRHVLIGMAIACSPCPGVSTVRAVAFQRNVEKEAVTMQHGRTRMRRAFGDTLISLGALATLLATLVMVDDRVREQVSMRFSGRTPSGELAD